MRETINFNEDWLFCLKDEERFAEKSCPENDFCKLRLPHDWSCGFAPDEKAPTGGGGGYATAGIGWYRKHFIIERSEDGERINLLFDGVYMNATVYLNGKRVGSHSYGYTSFVIDLTESLCTGENVLAVRVDNSCQPNSRWYSGSGIYRSVWMIRTDALHIDWWGIRCDTNGIYQEQNTADLQIRTFVKNESRESACVGILHQIYNAEGKLVSSSGTSLSLEPEECSQCMVRPAITEPHVWSDKDPYLYRLVTTVYRGEDAADRVETSIGIRTAVFDCDKGFLLNGVRTKIKGMCLHHDCGLWGAVGHREVWKRRLTALRDMGCNGIRCAHNPPDPVFLELCDELGFLVMDEIFDEWMLTKNKNDNYYSQAQAYGSAQFFASQGETLLKNMLWRDYNHPSVILWSIGNEIPEQSSTDGEKILRRLQDICHEEDGTRMVTAACDNIMSIEPIRTRREFENALDVVGYNYVGRWRERAETFYDEDKREYPKRRMIGSENPSVGGIRGNYTDWGFWGSYETATLHHEALWRYTASHDFVAGDYLWTGIDYLGECRWPLRGSSCAPLDTAGFAKDSFYYFRSIWNEEDITLHLLPHWNWKGEEGSFKQVICYTNCDEVRLYCNGRLVGTRGYMCPRYGAKKAWNDRPDVHPTTNDLHLSWDVPYEPGTLLAEGYRNGKLAAVAKVETTGEPVSLKAKAEEKQLVCGGIGQITLWTEDEAGRMVPDCNEMIQCTVEGPAHLAGMDAGDMSDLSRYGESKRRMFSGLLLAAVQADAPGKVKVSFSNGDALYAETEFTVCLDK